MKSYIFLLLVLVFAGLTACQSSKIELENGIWRGVFRTDSAVEIPFNFEIYDSAGTKQIAFINGKERLNINTLEVLGDSVIIKTPIYETEIRAKFDAERMTGVWIRKFPDKIQNMAFEATPNTNWRSVQKPNPAKHDITGRWSVIFRKDNSADTILAIGEFIQKGNQVSGTFATKYGDYRFLSGDIDGNLLSLSSYDGSGPSLFVATVSEEGLIGDRYSGPTTHMEWEARKDPQAMLEDAFNLTKLKLGYETLSFKFPDTAGKMISLTDKQFKDKVVIVQFLGSWCPNCMDETAFLSSFYKEYKDKGVEIIGLAYERYTETEKAKKAVKNLMDRFQVTYPILLTGYSNKTAEVLKSQPAFESYSAFPTTIIIDKKGLVRKIHTGFSGPAMEDAYTTYISDFEAIINQLLSE